MLTQNQIEWVLDFLIGSGPLGGFLFSRKDALDFSLAKVFPRAAQEREFQWGLPVGKEFCGGWVDFMSEIIRRMNDNSAFCLFRECDFKKGDPCMEHEKTPMVFVEDDIYYILDSASNEAQMKETINIANRFMLMCLINGDECKWKNGENVTYKQFEHLLGRLLAIAVGVCDDEGVCYIPYDAERYKMGLASVN